MDTDAISISRAITINRRAINRLWNDSYEHRRSKPKYPNICTHKCSLPTFNRDFAHCWRAFDMSNKYYLLTYLLTYLLPSTRAVSAAVWNVPRCLSNTDAFTGQITLVCIGPLTNVALALRIYPAFGTKLRHCIIMGGNTTGNCYRYYCYLSGPAIGLKSSQVK